MKYQIYLNQEASAIINTMARSGGMKESTFIKQVLETFALSAEDKLTEILKELSELKEVKNGTRKEAKPKQEIK